MSNQFELDQIAFVEEAITAINAAILFLIANPTKRYSLDTGQMKQEVTRQDLPWLREMRDGFLTERDTLIKRNCSKPIIQAPGW